MKKYNKIIVCVMLFWVMIFAFVISSKSITEKEADMTHNVEINRLWYEIENGLCYKDIEYDCLEYVYDIDRIERNSCDEKLRDFFCVFEKRYKIRLDDEYVYMFYYREINNIAMDYFYVIAVMLCVMLLSFLLLLYIRNKILKPFNEIKKMPLELSKGNLTNGLKESKSKYFGDFVWGLDMLRETLEQTKRRELELQKEKKTLILEVAHDVKTPLSAIKLYAKAIEKNLYKTDDKRIEVAANIDKKVNEIEKYISQIVEASNEDFLDLKVENSDFYLKEIMDKISGYYKEKLQLLRINFEVENYNNCLLCGDLDRAVEVMQNIIENAIKYGDGKCIKISFAEEENFRTIRISNTGCTLKNDEIIHIFDSFFRGSNVKNHAGNGLGLYICRKLMHKMQGQIFARRVNDFMEIEIVFQKKQV